MLSIKAKVIIIFTAITIALVLFMASLSYLTVKDNYLQQSEDHVKMLSSYMASTLDKNYLEFISDKNSKAFNFYQEYLKKQVGQAGIENAFIFNTDLKVVAFARKKISKSQLLLNKNDVANILPGASAVSFPFSDEQGRWYIWGFYRINDNYYLGIEESASRLETLNTLSNRFIFIGLVGILFIVIAGFFIAHGISKPVNKLVEFSKSIGSGNFTTVAPDNISGEFEILKDSMDKMKRDLSNKNVEREQMVAQIAHEIRNPLGGIELLTGLVLEDLQDNEGSKQHLEKILKELSGLKQQLTMFLEFSKPLSAQIEKCNLITIINEVEHYFSILLIEKEIDLKINLKADTLLFDYGHLKQIITNLVANSIEVLKHKGSIKINSISQNGYVEVLVSDSGPGIKKENMGNIFNPFFTTRANGTGLGLAISKKLCAINNANINFENNFGPGCTFKIQSKAG